MDLQDAIAIAEEYAKVVKSKFNSVRLVLFGSCVKGTYRTESDIDIAVILKDYSSLVETQLDLMRLRRGIDSRIEPHPFRERDFNNSNPLANEILSHGQDIVIH
jgi:predicted nucleotidyltransferase